MRIGARRRKHTALVGLTALSLAGAVLSAASAAAATRTVRVSVIGRDGTAQAAQVSLVDLAGKHRKRLTAGRSTAVANGRYAIGAFVHEAGSVTLIARTITVSKDLTVTLDARPGVRMTFGVDDPAAALSALEVVPFVGHHPVVTDPDRTIDPDDAMYVVPAAQDTAIRLGVHAVLSNPTATPTPTRYDLVHSYAGLPRHIAVTGSRAQLARVDMSFSAPDVEATRGLVLSARYANLDPVVDDQGLQPVEDLSDRLVSYRSPGLQWVSAVYLTSGAGGATMTQHSKAEAGQTSVERWGAGLWGIGPNIRIVTDGSTVHVDGADPICPPSGKGIALANCRSLDTDVTYRVSTKGHWYTVEMTAIRDAEADTATRVLGRWRVRANGADDGTSTPEMGRFRLFAGGLDTAHRAAAGSRSALDVSVSGLARVATLTVETSTDDGHSWHPATVTRSGSHWTANLTNPTAGAVSVRVSATSTTGASARQTILRAWGTH
ncbi:MAG TPA: hypothetical protein VGL04_12065 [Sporichthyaceae bacterium]|jgi:hypothetical protein